MNFLTWSVGEISGVVGIAATLTTAFLVPFVKWWKKRKKEQDDKNAKQAARDAKLDTLCEVVGVIKHQVDKNCDILTNYINDYDEFTTQNLKYMINDAYFGYDDIHDIPDDVLTNACECCEIYVNKKHKNHEIKPRCRLLWEEQERRAISREVRHE